MFKSKESSVNSLLNKALTTLKLATIAQAQSGLGDSHTHEKALTMKEKIFSYKPLSSCQPHTLHHAMKGLGYLPTPILESLIHYLDGPTSKQYPHTDAHLRLILAVNRKLKTPLDVMLMQELREKFATDAVAMQAPKVWKQASDTIFDNIGLNSINFNDIGLNKINLNNMKLHNLTLSNIKPFIKKGETLVRWEDKIIADADEGDMTLRCYQASKRSSRIGLKKHRTYNPDETVMLFLHGGGFCIGDIDTHHEFCHTVCERTGWSIVSVDYRLAPENPTPTALRDCITAYAWLAEHCHTLNALPSRIVLAGDSAGGGLATLMAQQLTKPLESAWLDLGIDGQKMFALLERLPKPLAQMPIYPVTDIETNYPSWELYGDGLLLDHADVAVFGEACFQNSRLPRIHILNSPMLGDNSKVCPTYVIVAELDVLRDEAIAYAKQINGYGILVKTQTVLGAPHGFIHLMSVHQGLGQETNDIIDGFVRFVHDLLSTNVQLAA